MSILTLRKYKEYKNITSNKEDLQLNKVIEAANSYITSYTNRNFESNTYVEYFDANDAEVYPSEYPLDSVTSIEVSTDGGETYSTTLNEYTDYSVDKINSRIVSNTDGFVTTLFPINAIKVTYIGGPSNVPEDIIQAAVSLVEYYVEEQYTPRMSMGGTSLDNIIVPDNTGKLPAHIRRILDHHRSINL